MRSIWVDEQDRLQSSRVPSLVYRNRTKCDYIEFATTNTSHKIKRVYHTNIAHLNYFAFFKRAAILIKQPLVF